MSERTWRRVDRAGLPLLTAALAALLAGCAGIPAEVPPAWVAGGEPEAYPQREYLLGSASASELDTARDRARAELARAFRVEIEAETRQDEMLELGSDGARLEQAVQRRVVTRAEGVLHGVEIAEAWHDPVAGRFHALAALHRGRAAAALREEISDLDAGTSAYLRQADEAKDALRALDAWSRALAAQRERGELQRALRVVAGRGVPLRHDVSELRAERWARIGSIHIAATADGDHADEVAAMLGAALGETGFRTNGNGSDYRLHARLALDDLGEHDGWYWFRGGLTVTLYGPAGDARGERRWPVRASAVDRATASQRAVERVAGVLERDLPAALLEIAAGE